MKTRIELILTGRIERELNEGRIEDAKATLLELYDMQEDSVYVDLFIVDLAEQITTIEEGL